MGNYKIQINVELIECKDETKVHDLKQDKDSNFTMTISEKDAMSIDLCERSVLMAAHPTIREAISKHLSEISKKKPLKKLKKDK